MSNECFLVFLCFFCSTLFQLFSCCSLFSFDLICFSCFFLFLLVVFLGFSCFFLLFLFICAIIRTLSIDWVVSFVRDYYIKPLHYQETLHTFRKAGLNTNKDDNKNLWQDIAIYFAPVNLPCCRHSWWSSQTSFEIWPQLNG